jgi:hypothetical protein
MAVGVLQTGFVTGVSKHIYAFSYAELYTTFWHCG